MKEGCPRCNSYNIEYTTGGIKCCDCNYPYLSKYNLTVSDNTKEEEITQEDEREFYRRACK